MSLWKRFKLLFKSKRPFSLGTPSERRRAERHAEWADVGFLRRKWHNDGRVAQGLMRSNNPNAERYRDYAAQGIRTVLNLRNDVNKAPCLLARERVEDAGMRYISYPMATRRAPTRDQLLGLIELFPMLEQPVLMHCKSGADRTGLAAAIWLLHQEGASLAEARKELGLRYLHFKESETGVLDAVLDQFAPFEGTVDFADWVAASYDPEKAKQAHLDAVADLGVWEKVRLLFKGTYRYAQHREAAWHRSYFGEPKSDAEKRRANVYINWIDHGILRGVHTNRAVVVPGVIRSNHPTPKRFRAEAKGGVRTILNLRGASEEPQYFVERDLCAELGLELIDFPLKATKRPTKAELARLIDILDEAPRPVLMHCKSGADRTGLAAAAYVLAQGGTMAEARRQLSARFLHFRAGRKGVLDTVLDDYEAEALAHGIGFRDWLACTVTCD